MLNIFVGLALFFSFVLSFGIGYIIGKGKLVINKRLTEEEKKQMEEFQKQVAEYNENIQQWAGMGDM